jgi:hypothetical protein
MFFKPSLRAVLCVIVSSLFIFAQQATPAFAIISGASVGGTTAADLIVAVADADYDIAFDTGVTAGATNIFLTFPAGYSITNGTIATSTGICSDECGTPGEITAGGTGVAVASISGNAGARIITISLESATDFSGGVSFRLTEGVTNPTTSGTTGSFGITTDAAGESGQNDVAGVTLTAESATDLVLSQAPSGAVSGIALTTQPVIEAHDQYGNVDTSFSEVITATEASAGALENSTTTAVSGVATFNALAYSATLDGETFTLTFDDEAGVGDDLAATSSVQLTADVVATKLVFTQAPAGAESGIPLTTQPVVSAQDSDNLTDTDFAEVITLTEASAGTLTNATTSAVNGVATFTNVTYTATADNESFTLTANDEDGVDTDLPTADANAVIASFDAPAGQSGGSGTCLNCGTTSDESDKATDETNEQPDNSDSGSEAGPEEDDETFFPDYNTLNPVLITRERLIELLEDYRRYMGIDTATSAPLTPAAVTFTKDLYRGIFDEEVRELQRYLNTVGFLLAAHAEGSPGYETTFFGPLTEAALTRFQLEHGIMPARGYFGPRTRALINPK